MSRTGTPDAPACVHCGKPAWPELMDAPTAARYLGISERTVRHWVQTGEIPYVRLGSKLLRFRRPTLDELAREHEVAAS